MVNCFYLMTRMWNLYKFTIIFYLAVAGEPGKRHARRANKLQVDSDWLNPNSLGIMSAFSYIENLA